MSLELNLPNTGIPRRVLAVPRLIDGQRKILADLKGPGCIRRIWMTLRPVLMHNRRAILRIYWDNELEPSVESPIGDFFGLCHGLPYYPIDSAYLSVTGQCGLTSYFPMPFAKRAKIEVESLPLQDSLFYHIDWQEYAPDAEIDPQRFHAQWRREFPAQAFGEEYLVLDAVGRGRLVGFNYGVRLYDDTARWSHGGADNIYIDGESQPAFLRGSGGEDTFGTSYGGVLHEPNTHRYQGVPYYVREDIGEPKAVQRLAAYRFFDPDPLPFHEHLHFRFGSVANDICSTAYWYQEEPHRPFFRMPEWPLMEPGTELRRGKCDLPLKTTGSWWLCGPFEDDAGQGMNNKLPPELPFTGEIEWDGGFKKDSPWRTASTIKPKQHMAGWVRRDAIAGFLDFNLAFRPHHKGVSVTHPAAACAVAWFESPYDSDAAVQLAWDDELTLQVNENCILTAENHAVFQSVQRQIPLRKGRNKVMVKLNNRMSLSWGGWCFAFALRLQDGTLLQPSADPGDLEAAQRHMPPVE